MRTIKFRGKRVDNGKWVYGYLLKHSSRTEILVSHSDQTLDYDIYSITPETVGQFTGLQDKIGKDCYDGDYDKDGTMIMFCDKCHSIEFHQIDIPTKDIIFCHKCEGNFYLEDHIKDFEIIGNIHDNPEMLTNG